MKKYNVCFVGNELHSMLQIQAKTEKQAKQLFADKHNVRLSNYIIVKRKTGLSYTELASLGLYSFQG